MAARGLHQSSVLDSCPGPDKKRSSDLVSRPFKRDSALRLGPAADPSVVASGWTRALAEQLSLAEDRVRRRLAEDLHDDLVQLLCAAKLKLARGSQSADLHAVREILTQTRELVESAERRGRSLCFDLSPPLEYRQDLSAAIDWLCAELQQRYDLRIDMQQPRPSVALSEATRSVVFRAVRELLINAAQHAPSRAA